jgi:hypothetical protein
MCSSIKIVTMQLYLCCFCCYKLLLWAAAFPANNFCSCSYDHLRETFWRTHLAENNPELYSNLLHTNLASPSDVWQWQLAICQGLLLIIAASYCKSRVHLMAVSLRIYPAARCKACNAWFLVNNQRDAQCFTMYLFLFLTLYVFWARCAWNM